MKDVFISFSSVEKDHAQHICDLLERNGFSCFISTRDLVPGQEYAGQLVDNIADSSVVVLLLSKTSNGSPHVLREIEYAVSHKVPILVYKLEELELSRSMEYFLMTHQWIADAENKEELLVEGVSGIVDAKKEASLVKPDISKVPSKKNDKKPDKKKVAIIAVISALLLIVVILSVFLVKLSNKLNSIESANSSAGDVPVAEVVKVIPEFSVGDTITFGTYHEAPIEWRVLKKNDDGTVTLVSKYLLTMKAFDSPEGGDYNHYDGVDYGSYENHVVTDEALLLLIRGNNDWSTCNLRTWLNSDEEVVKYSDFPPTYEAIGANYYNTEPGFLHSFTDSEKNALVTVINKSPANTFSENAADSVVTSEDRVYILSSDELVWFDESGISMYAVPTEECKAHDEYIKSYEVFTESYHTETYYWWLRDNSGEAINKVYVTTTENISSKKFFTDIVGSSYGVRPVITIDPSKM